MKHYQLTKHFALDEFTRSATATANGISNTLDMTKAEDRIVVENLEHLCQTVLEPLREFTGTPVIISSVVTLLIFRYDFSMTFLLLYYIVEK